MQVHLPNFVIIVLNDRGVGKDYHPKFHSEIQRVSH